VAASAPLLLCDELIESGHDEIAIPVLFRTLERLGDVDIGTPGPIVRTLQSEVSCTLSAIELPAKRCFEQLHRELTAIAGGLNRSMQHHLM
jgi:hypothetical protein